MLTPNLLEVAMRGSFQRGPKRGFMEILYLLGAFFFLGGKDEMPEVPDG
jgi:hypothetical protein